MNWVILSKLLVPHWNVFFTINFVRSRIAKHKKSKHSSTLQFSHVTIVTGKVARCNNPDNQSVYSRELQNKRKVVILNSYLRCHHDLCFNCGGGVPPVQVRVLTSWQRLRPPRTALNSLCMAKCPTIAERDISIPSDRAGRSLELLVAGWCKMDEEKVLWRQNTL